MSKSVIITCVKRIAKGIKNLFNFTRFVERIDKLFFRLLF